MQFTKLFSSILDSTIWQEPKETKIVWITMLAMSDRNGEVHASIPGLANRAHVTIEECESALDCLKSPDNYSRTKDHEGRRIEEMDGGWRLLNHAKYRALLSAEERREYNRRKQAEYRQKTRKPVNDMSMTVNHNKQCQHSTEAEAEAEAYIPPKSPCTLAQAKSQAAMARMTEAEAEYWWHTRNSAGWTKGTANGGTPRRITAWQSDMATSAGWVKESMAKQPAAEVTTRQFLD